jgi:hypothetical protein
LYSATAGAFDKERAALAVERLEMALVTLRQLDVRQRRHVEARLVEHQNDVRATAGSNAGLGLRFQALQRDRVGLHPAVGDQAGHGPDAGACKFGHVVGGKPVLPFLLRAGERQTDDPGETHRTGQRRPKPHNAERIEAPHQHDRDRRQRRRHEHGRAQAGIDAEQVGDRVGIDDEDVEEVDRHPAHGKLELRQRDDELDQR